MNDWLSSPSAFLAAYPTFRALDPAVQQELATALEPIELRAGQTLFVPGDPRDAVFFLLCGLVSLTAHGLGAGTTAPRVLGVGETIGEIGLVGAHPHSSTAQALDDTLVLRLPRHAFESLCEKYPEVVSALSLNIVPAARKRLLSGIIADLLGELDPAHRSALLDEIECRQLAPGDILFRQGEPANCMFLVIYGRIRTVTRDESGMETVVDESGRGDALGQRSLFAGEPHATTAYAIRDSAVGVVTQPLFELLQFQYPEVVVRLTRVAARRLQASAARRPSPPDAPHVASVAVLPVGAPRGAVPLAAFTGRVAAALAVSGTTLHLNSARVDALLGRPGIAQADAAAEPGLTGWLREQEQAHNCVIYEADDGWTPWTERCLRMCDRTLLVGLGGSAPVPTELDEPLVRLGDSTRTELVLLQPDATRRPAGTVAWLDRYRAAGHDHVRMSNRADFDRFIRHISGRALGLTLGGGGARGWAHMGVFKALAECGVDVDVVGGTSMGAILAGMYALGLSYDDILGLARQLASPLKLFDPTLPAVSFFASGKVTDVLRRIYGDTQIEDLWMPCFCVSSNLTRAVAVVHRRGPLWRAVRASMAIPGIFSPVLAEGDLLVDGCVLDNLPIDVTQRINYGGPIIAVNVFPDVDLLRQYDFGPSISGWQALARQLNPFSRGHNTAPLIFESLVRVMALNGVHQAKTQRWFADVYIRPPVEEYNILDFGAYREIAAIGYKSAIAALADWESAPPGVTAKARSDGAPAARPLPASYGTGSITAPLSKTLADLEDVLARMS